MSTNNYHTAAAMLSKEETIEIRKRHFGNSCKLLFRSDPLRLVKGKGQYLYDDKNAQYLDLVNNSGHVGHCHPTVVEAGYKQMQLLSLNTGFLHDNLALFAQRIQETLPAQLEVCFFVNSGSEANDLALRLARAHTKKKDVMVIDHAFHGNLSTMVDISPYKFDKRVGGEGKPEHVHVVPCPDTYTGKYRDKKNAGILYALEVKCALSLAEQQGRKIGAFIHEPILNFAGQVIPPKDYFSYAYKFVRASGGVCIADEIQSGFGRVGSHFWAYQLHGPEVVPDIITMGKAMGNGYPLAAVITTSKIAQSLGEKGMEYFNTNGGSPVACAIGMAVLDVIQKEQLMNNAKQVGDFLIQKLTEMKKDHPLIGDVRGTGLFLGVELVKDRESRLPAIVEAFHILYRLKERNILVGADGPYRNVVKLQPPMCLSLADAQHFLDTLEAILLEVKENGVKSAYMADHVLTPEGKGRYGEKTANAIYSSTELISLDEFNVLEGDDDPRGTTAPPPAKKSKKF